MFEISIERTHKFKYAIYRNRREVAVFYTKKDAKLKLIELHQDFKILNSSQAYYNFYPMFLRGGDCLVVYQSKRQTLADSIAQEFKDYYEIKREFNN